MNSPLQKLPYGLGVVQDYIYGRMIYPSRELAGLTAMAVFSHLMQKKWTIDSYDGLGMNEYYIALAPTGFGKESMRKAFISLTSESESSVNYAMPASCQALHRSLEDNNGMTILADEYSEWLKMAAKDMHKHSVISYMMQAYSSALGFLMPGHSITNKYDPVKCPRLSLFATTTPDRFTESISPSMAAAGAYNRCVIINANDAETKRYCKIDTRVTSTVIEAMRGADEDIFKTIKLDKKAMDVFILNDFTMIEPLRKTDNVMAARLSEQALKIAAIMAWSDTRKIISDDDMKAAYNIRMYLYNGCKQLFEDECALSTSHATVKAVEQVVSVLNKNGHVYISQMGLRSREYKKLSLSDQKQVLSSILSTGIARIEGKILVKNS